MRRRFPSRRPLLLALLASALALGAVAAFAYFFASGSGSTAAQSGSLLPATISAPTSSSVAVPISWTTQATLSSPSENNRLSYSLERRLGSGAYTTVTGGGCASPLPYGTDSCTDSTIPAEGTYTYRVIARLGASWTAVSNEVSVRVEATAPTATISFPVSGTTYAAAGFNAGCTPTGICGSAADTNGVAAVTVSVRRVSDGLYWNGSAWSGTTEIFRNATLGVPGGASTSWRYALPLPASDGAYVIHVQTKDTLGNTQSAGVYAASATFTIDTTPPSATISFPHDGTTYAASGFNAGCTPTGICGSASDASGVQSVAVSIRRTSDGLYWNGSSWAGSETFLAATLGSPGAAATSWRYGFALPADGSYSVRLRTTDTLANTLTPAAGATFRIDTTPPSATITFPVDAASYAAAGFTSGCFPTGICGSASDATGVQTVKLSIRRASDGAYWTGSGWGGTSETFTTATLASPGSASSAWSYPFALPAVDGSYTVHVQTTDTLANALSGVGYAASATFKIDATPPAASISFPVDGSTSKAATFTAGCAPTGICGSASDATGVQAVKLSIRRSSDSLYWTGTTWSGSETFNSATLASQNGTSSGWTYPFALPADGSYTVHVQTADTLGNSLSGTSYVATATFKIDTTAPTAALSFPTNGTTYAASAFNAGCTPTGLCGSAADATGVQTVSVSIRRPSDGLYWNGSAFSGSTETFNTATLASPGGASSSWVYPFVLPADGSYTVHVQTADTLGNALAGTTYAASVTFRIDTTPPSASVSVPANGATYTAASFAGGCTPTGLCGTAADATGVQAVSISIQRVSDGSYWNGSAFSGSAETFNTATLATPGGTSTTWSYSFALPPDGSYVLHAQAGDTVGNALTGSSYAATVSFAIDATPPTVALSDPGSYLRGTVTLSASASDASGVASVALQYALAGSGSWTTVCTDTSAPYSCNLNTAGGATPDNYYDFRALATDTLGNSASDTITDVLVDNTAPTATLTVPASPLRGVVTFTANPSDPGVNASGVATVTVQVAPAGSGNWTTACTSTATPWSCAWDSAAVAGGSYDFRAYVTDYAGNAGASTVSTRTVDNTVSSVYMNDPGPYIRGTVTLQATVTNPAANPSVAIQISVSGANTWTTVCTVTASPWSCPFDTTTRTDGLYDLRAVLTDASGTKTSNIVTDRIDNAPFRGLDVQSANASGGTIGLFQNGDKLILSYNKLANPSTLAAGWDGASPLTVYIRLRDGGLIGLGAKGDTIDVFTNSGLTTKFNVGSVNTKTDLIKGGKTAVFTGTATLSGTTATTVTITVGTLQSGSGLRKAGDRVLMAWTPSATATDTSGNPCSTTPVTQTGTAHINF